MVDCRVDHTVPLGSQKRTGMIKLRDLRVFSGPSIHARRPVVRALLDGDDVDDLPLTQVWTSLDRLMSSVDGMSRPLAAVRELLGDDDDVHWSRLFGALAVALQEDWFTDPLTFQIEPPANDGGRPVLVQFNEPKLGELSARFAVRWIPLIYDENWERKHEDPQGWLDESTQNFLNTRRRVRWHESSRLILDAAQRRDVPMLRLTDISETMVLGQGVKRQRVTRSLTDAGSAVAVRVIANSKIITSQVLREAAVPVPNQFVVRTRQQLTQAIERMGFPLVVKGATVEHGASVTTGVRSNDDVRNAVKKVQQFKSEIIIEEQIDGDDHRLTVIGGRFVAAARRIPARLTGDGESAIRELVEQENLRRRRSTQYPYWLVPFTLDDDALATLARQGHSEDSVPRAGEIVVFRSVANLSQGGLSEDVTDIVHPDVIRVAERAARLIGSDMAGVDILTTDISRPLTETGGAVLEVNNWPGLGPHYLIPTEPRDVAGALIDFLVPDEERGRIPTVAVTGTNGKTTTCRMLRRIFEADGRVVGMSTSNEVTIDGHLIVKGDCAGGPHPGMIVKDPIVEVGIFELARGALIRYGFHLDSCSIGVVTNVSNDHLGLDGIETIEDMARVKRFVAELARHGAVLNADDQYCAAMAPHISAPIWWFTRDVDNLLVRQHLDDGGNAVVIAERCGREVMLKCGSGGDEEIVAIADIPATWDGLLRVNVENATAAATAALAAGVAVDSVREALLSFTTSIDDSPGRFNIHKANGVTIIMDFAHNVVGLEKLIEFIDQIPQQGRRLCFFSQTNSRDQHHYGLVTKVLAHNFDHYIISDQTPLSSRRSETEIIDWMTDGLFVEGVDPQMVEVTTEVWEGVSRTLQMARPGDIIFLKTGADTRAYWDFVAGFDFATKTDFGTGKSEEDEFNA